MMVRSNGRGSLLLPHIDGPIDLVYGSQLLRIDHDSTSQIPGHWIAESGWTGNPCIATESTDNMLLSLPCITLFAVVPSGHRAGYVS